MHWLANEREEEGTASEMIRCEDRQEEDAVQTQTAASPVSSCVSLKSDGSMHKPPVFSDGAGTSDSR